jgi:pimeloyl-ACP methyl ester carboxylesterase
MADKEALVLVPGLLCTADLYASQIAGLADRASVTVGDHTRHASMADIARAILAAAPERFALAGLSMGGYIAFEIMRQAPDRVTKLALLDTMQTADTPDRSQNRRRQVAQARERGIQTVMDSLVPLFLHPEHAKDAALVARARKMADDTGVVAFARQQEAIIGRADSAPTLATIACPTLVIVGAQDELTPVARSREMAAGIAGARLEIIPDCGHLSTMEKPEAVTRLLAGWLSG